MLGVRPHACDVVGVFGTHDELDELPVRALDHAELVPAVSRGEDAGARLGQPELVVEARVSSTFGTPNVISANPAMPCARF